MRGLAFALAATAFAWSAYLALGGGIHLRVFGWILSSNSLAAPLIVAGIASAAFVAAGGSWRDPVRWAMAAVAIDRRIVAGALAAGVFAVGLAYGTTAVGDTDTYGYASQAELWRHGWPTVDQSWVRAAPWPWRELTFSPAGYRPSEKPGEATTIVPIYAPGLPLLMAAMKTVGGQEAMFWISPISGAILVLATFGIGRRIGAPDAGLVGAWLVATSPPVLFMMMAPMSDVPVAAAWAVAMYGMTGRRASDAALAGTAAAMAILIRPNLVFLAAVIGAWFVLRVIRASGRDRRVRAMQMVVFAGLAASGAGIVAYINQQLYGSPLRSGYGPLDGVFAAANVWPNVKLYVSWIAASHTPFVFLGFVALFAPIRALWPGVRDRSFFAMAAVFVAAVWISYCCYQVFDAWWYQRFLLATWPLIMIGVGAVAALAWRGGLARRLVTAAAVLALGAYGWHQAVAMQTFQIWKQERRYPGMALEVRRLTGRNAVILATDHSGSLRYYAGRMTMHASVMAPYRLDSTIDWLMAQGAHPYLVIDALEVPALRARFAGQQTLAVLDRHPLLTYRGLQPVFLFDLAPPAPGAPPMEVVVDEAWDDLRSIPPVAPPRIAFTP